MLGDTFASGSGGTGFDGLENSPVGKPQLTTHAEEISGTLVAGVAELGFVDVSCGGATGPSGVRSDAASCSAFQGKWWNREDRKPGGLSVRHVRACLNCDV